jgi:SOS response regulatory protein OraA/RecX
LLARAQRSEAEVEAHLRRLGFSGAAVSATLRRLRDRRFLDDGELARARARALAERGYGDCRILYDLERRGIGAELVTAAIGELAPERVRARSVLGRQSRGRGALRSAWRTLLQRGFSPESAEAVLGRPGEDQEPDL